MMPRHSVCGMHSAAAMLTKTRRRNGLCPFIVDMQLRTHIPYIVANNRKLSFNDVTY